MGEKYGGSAISPLLVSFGGLVILALLFIALDASFQAQNGKVAEAVNIGLAVLTLIAFIFSGAIIAILSYLPGGEAIKEISIIPGQNIKDSAFDFTLGFLAWFIVASLSKTYSVFSVFTLSTTNSVFSTASQQLTSVFSGVFLTTLAAPVAEEFLFSIAFPGLFLILLSALAKNTGFEFLNNRLIQFSIMIPPAAYIFAVFHIGKAMLVGFFISAIIFRALTLIVKYDSFEDTVPFVTGTVFFALGGHMANNIITTVGLTKWVEIMLFGATNGLEWFSGLFIIGLIGLIFFLATEKTLEILEEHGISLS